MKIGKKAINEISREILKSLLSQSAGKIRRDAVASKVLRIAMAQDGDRVSMHETQCLHEDIVEAIRKLRGDDFFD